MTQKQTRGRVGKGWRMAFLIAMAALAVIVGYGVTHFDAARWVPQADRPPVAPFRATILADAGKPRGPQLVDYKRLDARLSQLAAQQEIVGLAVAVVENGQLRFVKGYGTTAANEGTPVTANTVFRWASLSKGLAATMVAGLANDNRLSLDDPVARYAPSLKLPGGSEQKVTIADLLSHRLGIVHNAYDDKLEEGQDPRVIRTMLAKLDPYCPPAGCHGYQNVAFDAASEIVERVTREPYAEAVRQRLFAPLGMYSASVTKAGLESAKSWARPHVGRRMVAVEDAYYRVPAAGGVNSSVFDLAVWMMAQMGEAGSILPQRVLDEVHRPRVDSERRHRSRFDVEMVSPHYALGWREAFYDGHRVIGHRGAVRGYRSLIMFDPATRSGIVALWNSESNRPVGVQNEVLDMLYKRPFKDWLELNEKSAAVKGRDKRRS